MIVRCEKCGGTFDGASVNRCAVCSAKSSGQGSLLAGSGPYAEPLFDVTALDATGGATSRSLPRPRLEPHRPHRQT